MMIVKTGLSLFSQITLPTIGGDAANTVIAQFIRDLPFQTISCTLVMERLPGFGRNMPGILT